MASMMMTLKDGAAPVSRAAPVGQEAREMQVGRIAHEARESVGSVSGADSEDASAHAGEWIDTADGSGTVRRPES